MGYPGCIGNLAVWKVSESGRNVPRGRGHVKAGRARDGRIPAGDQPMSDRARPAPEPEAPATRAPRSFGPFRRWVCVPLGFLWLVVIGILAIPVLAWMTLLYHAGQAARRLTGNRRGAGRGESGEAEERLA